MNEFEQARCYGIVDIPRYTSCCFRVFLTQHHFITVQTSGQPMDVYWQGCVLIAEMENGQLRRYFGLSESSYEIVYT